MEPVILDATKQTPQIILNKQERLFEFSGCSLPNKANEFYIPILEWIDNYSENPNDKTVVVFKMDYYDTASSKFLYDILSQFDNLYKNGKDVEIHWHFAEEDENMEEAGMGYKEILEVPFKLISYVL